MKQGKNTCKILKEIRRQIAEANDIEFITSECRYQGDCLGTCPKCEAEVRYLEQQLEKKRLAGKAATIIGVSMGITSLAISTPVSAQTTETPITTVQQNQQTAGRINISGIVYDCTGKGIPNVTIREYKTDNNSVTDLQGRFYIQITGDRPLLLEHIGMKGQVLSVENMKEGSSYDFYLNKEIQDIDGSNRNTSHYENEEILNRPSIQNLPFKSYAQKRIMEGYICIEMPSFPGGDGEFQKFKERNLHYPLDAWKKGIEGTVELHFSINEEGKLSDIIVTKGVDDLLDKEAVRILQAMPRWKPAKQRYTPVPVEYCTSFVFKRDKNKAPSSKQVSYEGVEPVYSNVDKMPEFPGGATSLTTYLRTKTTQSLINGAAAAVGADHYGNITVSFVVEKDGNLTHIEIKESHNSCSHLNEEALQIIRSMPRWKPGERYGKPVRAKHVLTLQFR